MSRRFVLVIALLLSSLSAASFAQSTGDFSVVLLPDTQFYSESYPQIFNAQTQWIVNNVATKNIQMVIGEGDIVNHDNILAQWTNAENAANILNGKVPYTFAIGNHDYDNYAPSARGATEFNSHFGPQRYAGYSWYGGNYNGSNENFYTFFSAGGSNYMVLALEFFARDAVLQWANNVLSANPDKKVIIVTHSFEGTDGFRVDTCDTNDVSPSNGNNAQSVWNKLVRSHSNVFLVVSGHLIGTGTSHRTDLGDNGNLVHQIFTNFQGWTNGGNGYLRLLTFHVATNTIDVTTYSPYLNSSLTTSDHQFTLPLTYSPAASDAGGFSGKVRNTSCTRLPGATVSAAGFSATTDSNGIYTLQGLPAPNSYPVQASVSGYNASTLTASAPQALNAELNFYLTASTTSGPCTLSTVNPSVTICTPLANATVTSPVEVSAGVTSSLAVSYMQVYIDGALQKTFSSVKSIDQTFPIATTGSHRITVQAKNSAGTIFKSSVTVSVSSTNPPPSTTTVNITTPANNATVNSPFNVSASATPGTGLTISSMAVSLDGTQVFTTPSATVSTSVTAATGTHTLAVTATDSSSAVTTKTITITVGTTPPPPTTTTVTFTTPANGSTVSSPFTVSAKATPGTGLTISYINLYLDGVKKVGVTGATLNTTVTTTSGTHRLTAQTKDSAGTVVNNSINITVK